MNTTRTTATALVIQHGPGGGLGNWRAGCPNGVRGHTWCPRTNGSRSPSGSNTENHVDAVTALPPVAHRFADVMTSAGR